MPAFVTVAIVSWNTVDLLDRCVGSLRQDHEDGLVDIWVVDNGSSDGSVEMLESRHPWVQVLVPGANLGFGAAVNLVASRSQTPWVAPANADVRVTAGAISRLLAAGDEWPDAGVLAPRLLLPDGSVQPSIQPFPGPACSLLALTRLDRVVPAAGRRLHLEGHWSPGRAAEAPWATGAFLLVRRQAFDEAGGFDPSQWMYAEDLDLCWRIRRAGWSVRYEPNAVVHHDHGMAAGQAFEDIETRWRDATFVWLMRRRGLAAARATAALEMFDAGLRLSVAAVAARWLPVRWRPRLSRARRDLRIARRGLRPVPEHRPPDGLM